jgi:hypothetical protein
MEQGFQLRDVFNPGVVIQLAQSIGTTWSVFDQSGFIETINSQFKSLRFGD